MKKKLAIITTHPIQYNAPLFKLLTERNQIEIKVFYTWGESVLQNKFDPGFSKIIAWDIPLLEGYSYEFLENTAVDKGSHHFNGIINPGLNKAIQSFKADCVLVFGWSFNSHLKTIRFFKDKIPVFFRGDSTLLDKTPFFRSLRRSLFLHWVYAHIDKAFYVGGNNADYFKTFGLKTKQLVFAPHAVDNNNFSCLTDDCKNKALNFRTHLGINEHDFVFLFAGKLEQKKNPSLLIEAFISVNFSSSVNLVITGNGLLESELKSTYLNRQGIHFLDFQNQSAMPALYECADVFVLPSAGPGETWGLAVNEAMANGKPVIVSDKCGCAPDLVRDGENGYVFKSGDINDLKNKLIKIHSRLDIEEMKIISKKIIQDFSIEKICEAIEDEVLKS